MYIFYLQHVHITNMIKFHPLWPDVCIHACISTHSVLVHVDVDIHVHTTILHVLYIYTCSWLTLLCHSKITSTHTASPSPSLLPPQPQPPLQLSPHHQWLCSSPSAVGPAVPPVPSFPSPGPRGTAHSPHTVLAGPTAPSVGRGEGWVRLLTLLGGGELLCHYYFWRMAQYTHTVHIHVHVLSIRGRRYWNF